MVRGGLVWVACGWWWVGWGRVRMDGSSRSRWGSIVVPNGMFRGVRERTPSRVFVGECVSAGVGGVGECVGVGLGFVNRRCAVVPLAVSEVVPAQEVLRFNENPLSTIASRDSQVEDLDIHRIFSSMDEDDARFGSGPSSSMLDQ
jgi:hypothetical protein